MKTPRALVVVTAIENIATVVALSGFAWISSLPYRLSSSQAQVLNTGYTIVGWSLVVAWSGGIAALFGAWIMNRKGSCVAGKMIFWVVVSLLMTIAMTFIHLTSVRVESVGR